MREFKPKVKDGSNRYKVGTLLKAHNTIAFDTHGFVIVIDYKNQGVPVYILYSQKQQREWEMKAWVVNAFWVTAEPEASNKIET